MCRWLHHLHASEWVPGHQRGLHAGRQQLLNVWRLEGASSLQQWHLQHGQQRQPAAASKPGGLVHTLLCAHCLG